ncbi:MAG: dTMP kinase [Chitinophagaceae bacterium]|nr:dTMP kinase [Anaerolineae bacterium]
MFITFEGMDGSGKTTQVRQTAAYLRECGYEVLLTREPGGTNIGDQVRGVLLKQAESGEDEMQNSTMHPHTELLLFCASRAQLVAEVIRPHLERGGLVICDRYIDSTFAYQGYGHGLDLKALKSIVTFATGGLLPDLTVYLDITPEDSLKRRAAASLFGEEWNRLDDMELAFHQRVYKGYKALMKKEPQRWARIDARDSVAQVQHSIISALNKQLGLQIPQPH